MVTGQRVIEHTAWAIREHAARLKDRPDAEPIHVLIVDDEASVLRYVERVLGDAGYATVSALSGEDALRIAAERGPFDLLVTDLKMPRMRGDELARRLTYNDPQLRVLYLTGYSDALFKEKVALWEGEAYLDKPSTVNGLLEAVSMVLFDHLLPECPEPSTWRRLRPLLALH